MWWQPGSGTSAACEYIGFYVGTAAAHGCVFDRPTPKRESQRSLACMEVALTAPLEAVAVHTLTDCVTTLCSPYIPPTYKLTTQEILSLMNQLPIPLLIMGYFNAHNLIWGSFPWVSHCSLLERFLLSAGLCLLNTQKGRPL